MRDVMTHGLLPEPVAVQSVSSSASGLVGLGLI